MITALNGFSSLPAAFFDFADSNPGVTVYSQSVIDENDKPDVPRAWVSRTYDIVSERVQKIAYFLRSSGFGKGSKAAIVSSSRPEWMEADLGILALGGVAVSVYQSLPAEDVGYILFDSGSEYVFAENQEQVDKLIELLSGPITIPGTEERDETQAQVSLKKIIAFEKVNQHPLVTQLEEIVKAGEITPLDTYQQIGRDDLAALVYTSGTTGPPKGVMQTHGNHLANVRQVWEAELIGPDSSIMLFLPLAHSFAKLMGYLGFLTPATLKFAGIADKQSSKIHPDSVTKDIGEAGATVVPVVPRLLEKMQAGIVQKSRAGGLGGMLISSTLKSARAVYEGKQDGKSVSFGARLLYTLTGALRAKIRKKLFGENFLFAVSGGAKLNPQVARFFDSLDIEIVEGYGLTETCVATNVNRYKRKKIGTVGPVLADDIELKIGEDGEILFRGPNVALGYYNREQATKGSWDDDGWFHTGDLGAIDDDGYLSIVGRKKEIIVTSYGKNVAPEEVEGQVKSGSSFISQAVLVGDARPYCVALITLDPVAVEAWAKRHGVQVKDGNYAADQRVIDAVWKDVEKVNEDLANFESVKKILLIGEDFTVDNGLLTPTFKVKRGLVEEQFKEQIEALYSEN